MERETNTTKEYVKTPEIREVLLWQETYSNIVGRDRMSKWKREPFEMAPSAVPIENLDRSTLRLLSNGSWNINKATPSTDNKPLVALGGWCTFSEGDTAFIYRGILPDGTKISEPADLQYFLENRGNRWEQVIRSVGPVASGIPYLIVVEDSLWAERISQKLGKPEWKEYLTDIFKENARGISEGLVTNWLTTVTGEKREDVYFFYTSETEEVLKEAVDNFAGYLDYDGQKNLVYNMPVLTMYTGFWLNALKNYGRFENRSGNILLDKDTKGLVSEVDLHFRLRGKEQDLVGPFFWKNIISDVRWEDNPNKDLGIAGFYQHRIPAANSKLIPTYTLPYKDVLNISNRKSYLENLFDSSIPEDKSKYYTLGNPLMLEAANSLYWSEEARELITGLTLLPKKDAGVNPGSGKPVETAYFNAALELSAGLVTLLNNTYRDIGYSSSQENPAL